MERDVAKIVTLSIVAIVALDILTHPGGVRAAGGTAGHIWINILQVLSGASPTKWTTANA